MYDKNNSPVGWYIASYLIRFTELDDKDNNDHEKRFLSWENTIIVKAESFDEAYDKVIENAALNTKPYKGGVDVVPVQWVFEGVTELLPIYEELEDGAEIMWSEHNSRKLRTLRKWVKEKHDLRRKNT